MCVHPHAVLTFLIYLMVSEYSLLLNNWEKPVKENSEEMNRYDYI